MTNAADRARHAQAVGEILAFMSKCGLALDDLIQISGDDLKSSNPKRAEKARRVSKCWELMARLSVCFADLEQGGLPTRASRGRRGEANSTLSRIRL